MEQHKDQQKQPVAPDTKTAPGTQPPQQQKGNSGQDHDGNKQANPANVVQPPLAKQPNASTSADAPKAL